MTPSLDLGRFEIIEVRRAVIDGRPQLVLDARPIKGGEAMTLVLSRAMARELTDTFGPHPLVEEFFADGDALQ